jgi:hypothetical protein
MPVNLMPAVNKAFREHRRYTGDGLPGAPVSAPLPVGDPSSGPNNPQKSEIRQAFADVETAINAGLEDLDTQAADAAASAAAAAASAAQAATFIPGNYYTEAEADALFPQVNTGRRADGKGLWWDTATSRHVYAWASPADATIDLRDLLDEQHGVGGWTQRTGVNTGTNCTVALTLGLDRLRARYGRGRILIPPGTFLFNTAIDAAKLSGIVIEGVHELASQLVWAGGATSFLRWSGAGGFSGGGARKLGIYREDGFSAVSNGIQLQGDATFQPDQFNVEDIYMSSLGTGFWATNLFLDGQARTAPQGVRVVSGRNLQLFRSGSGGGYGAGFFNVVQADFLNVGTYAGTGALGANIYVGGGGSASTNTIQMSLDRLACGGELNLTNQQRTYFNGFCGNLAMATSADFLWGWLDASSTAGSVGPSSNLIIR